MISGKDANNKTAVHNSTSGFESNTVSSQIRLSFTFLNLVKHSSYLWKLRSHSRPCCKYLLVGKSQGLVNKSEASLKPDPIDKSIVSFLCYFRTLQPVKSELDISSGTIGHHSNVCLVGTNIEGFHHVFQEL